MPDLPKIDIRPDHWEIVRSILQKHVPQHAVWAFGSRAKWTAKEYSDLDLAVITEKPLSLDVSASLSDDFSESDLPWKVDVVDWATTSESFRKIIERDKVVVQKAGRGWGMASEVQWFEKPLGDVTVNHDGKRRPVKESERKKGPYPYYGASGIVGYVDDYIFEGRHLLIAEDGENLRTRQTPIAFMADGKFWVNNHAHIVTGKNGVTTEYLRYFLQNADIQSYLTGAVMPKLTQGNLNRIAVRYPKHEHQNTIVRVLGALDDKIDLNRRINQTLEAMAQAIFKSWFVDFDPVKARIAARQEGRDPLRAAMSAISGKADAELDALPPEQFAPLAATAALFPEEMVESELGKIPRGWTTGSLSDFASFQNGYAFKTKDWTDSGHPVVKIGNVKPGIIDLSGCSFVAHETVDGLERFSLNRGDLLVGMTGYVGETGLVPALDSDAYLNQRVGRISTSNRINDVGYPFCLARDPAYKAYAESKAHGSAQANVSGKDLMDYAAVVPSAEVLNIFNAQVAKFINALLSYHEESQSLATIRDTLLPKLLSGELSVADIAPAIDEVPV